MNRRRFVTSLLLLPLGASSAACDQVFGGPTPTPAPPTSTPRPTATPLPPTPTPSPTPAPTATPQLAEGEAMVVGGVLRTREEPSSTSELVTTLPDRQRLEIAGRVAGENWLVGSQTWLSYSPPWASEWIELADGTFVYAPFVFVLAPGERTPLAPAPDGLEKWIDVNIVEQRARAMIGDEAVYEAKMSSGAPPFETPRGSFAVEPDGRIAVEKMTASQAGYESEQARYEVERVLFTQYFDRKGNALHLNYWRPPDVFGVTPTSHGCVGLELHEAQYLWLFAEPGTRVEIHA